MNKQQKAIARRKARIQDRMTIREIMRLLDGRMIIANANIVGECSVSPRYPGRSVVVVDNYIDCGEESESWFIRIPSDKYAK